MKRHGRTAPVTGTRKIALFREKVATFSEKRAKSRKTRDLEITLLAVSRNGIKRVPGTRIFYEKVANISKKDAILTKKSRF